MLTQSLESTAWREKCAQLQKINQTQQNEIAELRSDIVNLDEHIEGIFKEVPFPDNSLYCVASYFRMSVHSRQQ